MYSATAVVLLNVLAGGKGSRRRNQKLMINIVGFFSRYTYHSLLVVQGSISIAYWSSQPSVPQHTTTPPGPPLLPRCVFLLGLAAFGDVISYIRCKDSSRAHIFTLHCASGVQTDLSSNSIQQHRVPAWPAGRPREYQHGLLVVQGSISMACWSSQPSVPQYTHR